MRNAADKLIVAGRPVPILQTCLCGLMELFSEMVSKRGACVGRGGRFPEKPHVFLSECNRRSGDLWWVQHDPGISLIKRRAEQSSIDNLSVLGRINAL